MNDVMKTRENLGHFIKQIEIAFMSLYCDRSIPDAISTTKIPENTQLCLVFALGILPVEMTFMFPSEY